MTYFAKPANLARIETMRQQNRHIVQSNCVLASK